MQARGGGELGGTTVTRVLQASDKEKIEMARESGLEQMTKSDYHNIIWFMMRFVVA